LTSQNSPEKSKEIKIILKRLDEIIPYINNPRKNDGAAVEKVASSIREFGFKVPIIIDKAGTIVAGHTRYKASKKLGLVEVPCIIAEDLTETQIKAFRIADNRTAEESSWDFELLSVEVESLDDFDLSILGFDEKEMARILRDDAVVDDDFYEEPPENPNTRPGDIWILGKHRVICGDATVRDDISKLMGDALSDLVLTDPPYNVDYEGGTDEKLKIQNDKMADLEFLKFLTDAFSLMHEYSKKGAPIYVFHADSEGYNFRSAFKAAGYNLRQCLIWEKNSLVMGRQDYQWQHEPVLYGWKDGASHAWYGDRKQTTIIKHDKPLRNGEHPTMKPIGLCGYFIANSSKEGDIVLDPFGGSGSTLIACEQLGRECRMIELDTKYVDVIVHRFLNFMGESSGVHLIRDGLTRAYDELKIGPEKDV
jgi:site-specific DNA-methyltransferase (adenine-specific)